MSQADRQAVEKPLFMVVDGAIGVKRDTDRKFGRHEKKFALLPYYEELSCEVDARFEHIKHGLVTAVLVNEQRPALRNYIYALKMFLNIYGFRFQREDHINLIRLLYLILVKKDQWPEIIHYAAKALETLVIKSYLSYKELSLDWEPLFNLYYGANYGKLEEVDGKELRNPVFRLKRFYKPTDTPEIWDRIQVYLSPRYSTKEFCDLALLFLSVKMTTDEHKSYGAGLWFDTMWKMYEVVEMGNKWGSELPNLFATLAYNNPDFMDWTPLYDTIFTRTIRAMGLSIREGKVAVGDGTGATSLSALARMVVATLGGPYSCQQHLGRMMEVVEPFMHPSNESGHTLLVLVFLHNILQELVNRYIEERVKKHKREVPTKFYLTDDDIANFTDAVLQSLLYALYAKQGSTSKTPAKLVMVLAALCPGRVLPRFFEHTYPAMFAVDEPHRLTQTLDCLFESVFLIARDNDPSLKRLKMEKDWIEKMEKIRSPLSPIAEYSLNKLSRSLGFNIRNRLSTFRCHLFYFLEMLIEGIDINDVSKANITIHNLTLIFCITPILDYSDCVKYHTDLTDEEKALCKMSARLPVLAEMALNKMLEIIQCLSITAPKDSSTVIGGFKDVATKDGSEEKVLKKAVDRCVTAMCKNANSSKLGRKMLQFVKTNQFESSLATDMISSMMASMTYELPSFWILFAKHVLHNLRIVLTPEVKEAEDLDATASWFVSLASSLLATTSENYINHKDICFEMIDFLVTCKSKVAYASGSVGLWNSMYMLSRVYPENSRYMSEKLDRSLKEWVPIREWGRLYEIKDMKMAWHIPNNRGKAVIEEMLKKFLFPVMDLVNSVEVDRETLKKSFTIINSIFTGGATCFSLPSSPLFQSSSTALPWFNANIPNAASELSTATEIKDEIFTYLTDPVKKGYPSYVYESLVYVCHMKNATATSTPFTEFHLRVVRLLTRLSLNVYAEGALNVILKSKWATNTRKSAKMKVWQALLDMNAIEMPTILNVFEEICSDIGNMQKPSLKHYKCEKLLSFCEKMFEKLPKTGEWQKFNCKNSLDLTRQIQEEKRNKSKAEQKALVEMLLQRFANKDMLHTRVKLCRTMLWRCQMEKSRLETIKIILSKFTDEEQYHRERSADELSFWLKKNKALTIRMDWVCPKKYTLRNFAHSTIIFDRFTKTLQELLKSRQRAEQRLAAEFFAGVAMGTKYHGFSVLNKLWSWLAPAVDLLYDYLNEDAYFSWHFCITNVLHRDDTRRYWWLIEELLKGMARTAPTAWHHAVALKNVCVVLDANMNNDFRGLPNRFHLESVDFWLQRFKGNLDETPNIKSRLASETVIQFDGGVKANELAAKFMAVHSSSSMVDLSQIYLRTLLEFLLQYYTDCITCLTPGIVSLFPVLLEYANEGDNDIYGSFKDMDISHSASLLIHDEMSTLQLTPKFADSFLNVVLQSFYTSYLWRVKVSVLKFIKVLVFSNIYELEKATRPEKVLRLLYDAIVDPQTEVRREASRAMLTLILCGYIKVNDDLSKYFNNLMKNKNLSTLHGAILGMGAVVRAHPFSTPLAIKPMLAALCEVTSHNAELQKAATTALREFRRTHRDNWEKVAKILGPDLVYKIENAIAPVYYA
ncbi:unnamed protein product [Angiostrongylus costaricensis]|uniref:BLM10_mid domain-containing protein n=1 Tax=Angiostrongylus costaricensis TaxID=334426 RepID=A0A158PE21_ANGCS|nr:unnamed protein product [Angiostrongylus costaricensis]